MIGYDELPIKEIPADFEADTWVEIDGDRWKVVGVEPSKPSKAARTGTLVVHVELVERRTPAEEAPVEAVKEAPLYVQPSRADQMPRMSGKREDLQLLEMGSWEWRDCELTLAENKSVVRDVFGKIEELISLNGTVRDGQTFYTRQYERYEFFAPLRGSKVPLEMIVTAYFPQARAVDGLTFMGSAQVADSTFVFKVESGIMFYGQEFDEVVRYLAVCRPGQLLLDALREDIEQLAAFMRKKRLILVDWPKRKIVDADGAQLLDHFLEGFAADAIAAAQQAWTARPAMPQQEKEGDASSPAMVNEGLLEAEAVPDQQEAEVSTAEEETPVAEPITAQSLEPVQEDSAANEEISTHQSLPQEEEPTDSEGPS